MDRLRQFDRFGEQRDSGRISVLITLGVGFLAWYGLQRLDGSPTDNDTTAVVESTLSSVESIGNADGQIVPSTISPEDQALLDAISAHHASTVPAADSPVADASVTSSSLLMPETTHDETHDSTPDTMTPTFVDTTTSHSHTPEQPEPIVVTQTATTIAHSTHTPAPIVPSSPQQVSPNTPHGGAHSPVVTPVAQPPAPSPETTHAPNHTPVAPPETQPNVVSAPITISSTLPPQVAVQTPGG